MKVKGLIWLDQFIEKLATKHSVTLEEVEELFDNRPDFKRIGRGKVQGENLYRVIGQTYAGRYKD